MKNVLKSKKVVSFFSFAMVITVLMIPTIALASTNSIMWSYLVGCDVGLFRGDLFSTVDVVACTEVDSGYEASAEAQLQSYIGGSWVNVPGYWHDRQGDSFAAVEKCNVIVPSGVYRVHSVHHAFNIGGTNSLERFGQYSSQLTVNGL